VRVEKDNIITIHYTIKDENTEIVDSSLDEEPLEYLHGHDFMLPGLEKALEGLQKGASVALWLSPEEGFGDRREDYIMELDRSDFEQDMELEAGMEFEVEDEDGEGIITVIKIDGERIVVDRNHPLSGKRLYAEAEVLDIKKAEDWEIQGWKHHSH